jgi:hypothetical protein
LERGIVGEDRLFVFWERNEVAKNKKARPNYFLDDKLQFV